MRRGAASFLIIALAFGTRAAAASVPFNGPLTLGAAVARVEQAGFDVRMARASADAARAQEGSENAMLAPHAGISETYVNGHLPQLGMPVAQQTYFSVTASAPIVALHDWLAARSAGLAAGAASGDLTMTRLDAALAVTQSYYQAQLAAAVVEARQRTLDDQSENLRLTQERVAVGKLPRYLTARDQAAVASAQQMLEEARSQRDQAMFGLVAMLDYGVSSRVTLATPLAVQGSPPLDEQKWLARALVQRPDVLAADERVRSAQASVAAARASYVPNVSAQAQTYSGTSTPPQGTAGSSVGVSATLPVLDGGDRAAAYHAARAQLDNALGTYDRARANAQRDVLDALREVQAAQSEYRSAQSELVNSQIQLRIAQMRQAAGKGIYLEVLDAIAVSADARESIVRATARVDDSIAALHHAAGDQLPWQ